MRRNGRPRMLRPSRGALGRPAPPPICAAPAKIAAPSRSLALVPFSRNVCLRAPTRASVASSSRAPVLSVPSTGMCGAWAGWGRRFVGRPSSSGCQSWAQCRISGQMHESCELYTKCINDESRELQAKCMNLASPTIPRAQGSAAGRRNCYLAPPQLLPAVDLAEAGINSFHEGLGGKPPRAAGRPAARVRAILCIAPDSAARPRRFGPAAWRRAGRSARTEITVHGGPRG